MRWIKQEMQRAGKSQREVADAAQMTEQQLSKVLAGVRLLKSEEADRIRKFFGYLIPDDEDLTDLERRLIRALPNLDDRAKQSLALYLEAISQDQESQPQSQ